MSALREQLRNPEATSSGSQNKLAPATQQFLNDILAQARLKRAENASNRASRANSVTPATPQKVESDREAIVDETPASPASTIDMSGRQAEVPSTPTRAPGRLTTSPLRIQKAERRPDGTFQEPTLALADPYAAGSPSSYAPPTGVGKPMAASQPAALGMVNSSTQTAITQESLDTMIKDSKRRSAANSAANSPIVARSPASGRAMSMTSASDPNLSKTLKRPSSSSGTTSRDPEIPPLPPGHKELIAQAKDRSSSLMSMPPPNLTPMPKAPRDRSSSNFGASPGRPGFATQAGSSRHRTSSMAGTIVSRRSSVSSFASEIDERFHSEMNRGSYLDLPAGAGTIADPRMIQAITQTMIGEFLWKYTRKAGRGDTHSENRHRRFFWIHPYTRTLYWSNQDPSVSGRNELKAKSVAIEAVRVISDDNPLPPGLSNKSIVVVTPGRSIKFTAPTARRHEVWYNALSYLLLRSAPERDDDATLGANIYSNTANYSQPNMNRSDTISSDITNDDLRDFNAGYSRTTSRMSQRSTASGRKSALSAQRTSSPQRAPTNSLAFRQSQAAAKRAASTLQPGPLNANPASSDSDAAKRASALAASEMDADGFKKPALPNRPTSTTTNGSKEGSTADSTQTKGGKLSSLTSRISRASFASLGRGRKSTRAEPADSLPTSNDGSMPMPAEPATLATLDGTDTQDSGHKHSYKTERKDDGTLENVRACCNGKHDLASLRNRSESRTSLRRSLSRTGMGAGGNGSRRSLSQRLSGLPAGGP